jgi:thiamine transport system permease protein
LPALRPAITAAASIVFLFTFTSFGVVLILGGARYSTLEVEIYRQTAELLNLPTAAALSIVQLAAVVAVLALSGRAQRRRSDALRLRSRAEVSEPVRTRGARATLLANLALMALLLGIPVAVLVERSLDTGRGYGFGFYRALAHAPGDSTFFVPPLEAIRNSLVFAVFATAIAVVVGGLAAFAIVRRRGPGTSAPSRGARLVDTLVMLPLGTSAVIVGFGFLITLDHPPIDLRTSPVLIPIAHALVATPFVVRTMVPVLRSIDPRLREAASVLGAGPSRVWREVDLPIVARAALVAAGFAFAISLGEFGATIFIARPDYPTLPVVIYRLLGKPGVLNFGQAMAASVILMLVTGGAVLLIERFRAGSVGEF